MKRFILALLVFGFAGWGQGATYYGTSVGGSTASVTCWSLVATKSAARVSAAATPGPTDLVILDDYSGNVSITSVNRLTRIV